MYCIIIIIIFNPNCVGLFKEQFKQNFSGIIHYMYSLYNNLLWNKLRNY